MIPEDNPSEVMNIIVSGGDARKACLAAVDSAKNGDFAAAKKELDAASAAIGVAQKAHNRLLSQEARGVGPDFSVLLVHAESHLGNAQALYDMAKEFVLLYKELRTK
ncbi:PTS lactose/cellobiose transporter subunit IIA [Lacticaseibacillus zhaodongensis]|uniref:PTS lactose/cellobiose transporter subunit IIA n=1 Tax=Lacticaseibacillus zhaodongensis TaxID=2668065 RepID=UPI0012D33D03|nr:PTS lactose/cellobiose transporter subunit IIA [Lacticaseibacillus zhaodongensis]